MEIAAFLTSAGINVGLCGVLFSLYSILRKQPSNRIVYFGRRLTSLHVRRKDLFSLERFVPSPSWIVRAWETKEDEILASGGIDAVVFQRLLILSLRIFCIAAVVSMSLVLPVNYGGKELPHNGKDAPHNLLASESLDVFTIANVREGSEWLWAHCLALYIISCSTCILLYLEYKSIAKMRLAHITRSPASASHFTVLVRSVPYTPGESYSESVLKFFSNYYASSYLSHHMVYESGVFQKLLDICVVIVTKAMPREVLWIPYLSFVGDAEKICKSIKAVSLDRPSLGSCFLCAGSTTSFKILSSEPESVKRGNGFGGLDLNTRDSECSAAFVFFKTRYAAVLCTQTLQSSNPMMWVTEMAPEPHDVLWGNLSIPYKQLWLRKIATLLAATVFMFLFLIPVTFVQGLTQLDKLSRTFPFLTGILEKPFISHVVIGYLPSVILVLFLYTVPPTMMLFSSMEGPVSRSGRKRSACLKILHFTIWNVFFVNVLSGSAISQLNVFSSVKDIPTQLAKAISTQASFFMTYVLTSGWTSLACELMQLFPLLCNLFKKFILRDKEDSSECLLSFPYHTELPRVLLFGLIGFNFSIMAPLILPFLLVYFFLAFLVYRNQILNVYVTKYESGGLFWPIVHNTTIFSLVLTQIITLGVFGLKESPVSSSFTIPLVIFTLLFNEYCRKRFYPIFKKTAAQVLIEMDRRDEQRGRMEDICQQFHMAYCQSPLAYRGFCESAHMRERKEEQTQDPEAAKPGKSIQLQERGLCNGEESSFGRS